MIHLVLMDWKGSKCRIYRTKFSSYLPWKLQHVLQNHNFWSHYTCLFPLSMYLFAIRHLLSRELVTKMNLLGIVSINLPSWAHVRLKWSEADLNTFDRLPPFILDFFFFASWTGSSGAVLYGLTSVSDYDSTSPFCFFERFFSENLVSNQWITFSNCSISC